MLISAPVVMGVASYARLGVDLFPNVDLPMVVVTTTLKGASVSLLSGRVRLSGLHIGNPQGFKTESLFDVHTIEVKLKLSSLLSDTIVIEKILVEAPEITFERGIRQSNFGALIEGLSRKSGGAEKPAPEAKPSDASKPGKKVVIDELTVSDGKVKLLSLIHISEPTRPY